MTILPIRRVEAVGPHQVEDLVRSWAEARVDQRELVTAVDQIRVAVEPVGEIEPVVPAADEIDVVGELHAQAGNRVDVCGETTIDHQVDARDVGGVVGCEERERRSHVLGASRADPSERPETPPGATCPSALSPTRSTDCCVSLGPGLTQLTRIPYSTSSSAMVLTRFATPALAA